MSNFTKGQGAKIGIGFTSELVGDVSEKFGYGYVKPEGTFSASNTVSGYPISNAFDGDMGTYWYNYSGGSSQWLQIQFAEKFTIAGFRWANMTGYRPKDFKVQGSYNGSTWTDIHTGQSANAEGWQSFTFDEVSYKYYRWTFLNYHNSYIQLLEMELRIPAGNELAFSVTGQQYRYINGDLLDMKYKIASIERHPTLEKAILLTFDTFSRFPTVEENITITYDATKGNLAGKGGAVQSFTKTFKPQELIPEPNPGIKEYLSAVPDIEVEFITIEYVNAFVKETITAVPDIEIEFIDVTIINP